jgi:hypothetical protein
MMKNSAGSRVSATRTILDRKATMSSTCLDCVTTNSSRDPICRSTCRTVALLGRAEAVATEAATASATSKRSIWSRSSNPAKWPPIWPSGRQSILSNVGTESSVVCPPADGDSSAQRADQVQSGNSHFRHPRRSSQNPKVK